MTTMTERINTARVAHGLPPLAESDALAKAAGGHAADLSRNEWLIAQRRWHEGIDGSSISDRLIRAGYRGARWRENVGWGFGGDEAQMFDWWMGSPVHRDAILAADVTEVGAARVFVPSSPWGYYWAVDFGRPAAAPTAKVCPCCGRG